MNCQVDIIKFGALVQFQARLGAGACWVVHGDAETRYPNPETRR
jgi:hypothetical protein